MSKDMALPIVASLWIGGRLSFLEQVCLKSFVDHGHRTILYAYGDVGAVPDGVEVFDANRIFPADTYICHAKSGSPAVHADAFRYRMLELQNVIWVDADMLCMRPWDFRDGWVFGWEKPGRLICNAVLGLPRFSKTLRKLNALCADEYPIPPWAPPEEKAMLEAAAKAGNPVHVSELAWGVWGPAALTHFLHETEEIAHVLPQMAFFPISFKDRRDLLVPGDAVDQRLDEGCYGVHLWNRRLRRRIITHEGGVPHPDSFLGRALTRHGIDPELAPIPDVPPAHVVAEAEERARRETRDPPAAWRDMPIMRLTQSPDYQRMIDDLEDRTGNSAGWLVPPDTEPGPQKVLVVTSMKNEGPFILEWVAYHLGIGVDHFLVYTNDCDDNTNAILDRLQALGLVTRRDNPWDPASGKKPQHVALKDATKQACYKDADWVLTIDVDEFVNIHVGDGTIDDLLLASNYPNVLSLTWKFFGNNGIEAFEDRPITEQFTACAPEFIPKPRLGWGFKSMVHTSAPYGRIGVHRPLDVDPDALDQVRWVNGSGRVMPEQLLTNSGWRSTKRSLGYRLATLNHYILRSAESFLVKRQRGRINHTDEDQGLDYRSRRNYATETDTRIQGRAGLMQPWQERFAQDPDLPGLHDAAVAWHRARIAALREQPDYQSLFSAITAKDQTDALYLGKPEAEDDPEERGQAKAPATVEPRFFLVPPRTALVAPQDPRWGDGRRAAEAEGGFFWEGEENALMFVPRSRRLVVTFDNILTTREEGPRWPWGYKVLREDMGCSVLGVMGSRRNWFRHDFVHDSFEALRDQGFFQGFDDILFYGASMGGFGALTYVRCAPGSHVLALGPQSTLSADILPDETRWRWTQKLDWDGPYADAAGHLDAAGHVMIVSDPYFAEDQAHVARLEGDNITFLRTPFMGHQLPNAFRGMEILKPMLSAAVDGALTPALFYKLFRARRDLPRYQHDLLMEAEARGKTRSAIKICEYTLKKRDARNIARSLERLKDQLAKEPLKPAAE